MLDWVNLSDHAIKLAGPQCSHRRASASTHLERGAFVAFGGWGSGLTQSSDTAGTMFDSITTVGELHESLAQHFGPAGWTALVSLWQEAAGIQQPERQPNPGFAPILAVDLDGKADVPLQPLPSDACPMETGLHAALYVMTERVQAFMLYQSKPPPTWRYVESEGERAERQALEIWVLGPAEPKLNSRLFQFHTRRSTDRLVSPL